MALTHDLRQLHDLFNAPTSLVLVIVPKSSASRFRRFKPIFSRQESKGNPPTQPKLHCNLLGSPKQQPDRKNRAILMLSVARRSWIFGTLTTRQTKTISQNSRVCSKLDVAGLGWCVGCCGVGTKRASMRLSRSIKNLHETEHLPNPPSTLPPLFLNLFLPSWP